MESREELELELKKIKKWEKSASGLWFWERISRLPFKLLDKLTPHFIHNKIGILLDELGSFIQTGGKYLTSEKQIFRLIEKESDVRIESYEDIDHLSLQEMRTICDELIQRRTKVATLQGATTGIGGIVTLAIDIPAILGLSLKTLQEIAIIHGFNPNNKDERIFIIKCLQFSSSDVVGKKAILKELSAFYNQDERSNEVMSQIQGWREVVYTFRDQFGWKKLFQMVPIAGILFGAISNRSMINDVAEVGKMLYQKRKVQERLHQLEMKDFN
ncbi:EcsC family protein [Heyndrickxia oleronia]|uniref:EcsC family protein n=1 Tax=Heyndrickxia oleronia TaxID=38875 RepID=UPI00203A555B|nr:EcsC family protein [Heyndrickxia oleronia]MCM3236574.1 EcsC family protein [Heyndrickxia oleronia]